MSPPTEARRTETRTPGLRLRLTLVSLAVLALAAETYLVAGRAVGVPRVPKRADSFLVDGLATGRRVSQTFLLRAGGFNGVEIRIAARNPSPGGELALALYEVARDEDGAVVDGEQRLLFRDVVPVRTASSQPTFMFDVPPIDESAGRSYRLDLWMPEPRPEDEISVWATDGRWSEGGTLAINGQDGDSELVYEARATRATVWARLRHHFGAAGLAAVLCLAAGVHAALFLGLRALVAMTAAPGAVECKVEN